MSKMPIKHEAKLSALFYVYQEIGHALTILKNLHIAKCLVKAYPFQLAITWSSINFVISGKTILDDIPSKCFSK